MMALLGPTPKLLIERERDMRHWRWTLQVLNHQGHLCNNAADFFGGLFFTNDDKPEWNGSLNTNNN